MPATNLRDSILFSLNDADASKRAHRTPLQPTVLLNRAAAGDRLAAAKCVAIYGDIVWDIAKRCTDCTESAESLSMEIFAEIWRLAKTEIVGSDRDFIRETAIRQVLRHELDNARPHSVH